ncbi:aldo/keto reductase [Bacteroides sp. 51]|nr:aldo/keto reductase [Bacteroides sp. 51]
MKDMTEKVKLNNGVEMPWVGLGVFRMDNDDDTQIVIEKALAMGYRHIDTAAYYDNEEAVGKAIQSSGIPRKEVFITTKVWNEDQRQGTVRQAFEDSLRKLGTDYVDLYLIHWPVPGKFKETWKIFEEIYNTGRAKAIGVSNFKKHHLEELKDVSTITPAVNQIELHPYLVQQEDLDYCNENGIRVEAWSPFAANKFNLFNEKIIIDIAEKHEKSPAQIILRWDHQRGVVVIPKSSNEKRLAENIDIFDFKLSDEEIAQISALNRNKRVGSDPDHFDF